MADSSGSANSANVTSIGNSLEEALGERLISAGRIDAIAYFRDKDDLERLNGAEDSAYSAAGREYGPKNARFETVDELRRVLGVTPDIYRRLAPLVTVHSGRRGINPVTAPHALLLALPGGDPGQIDDLVAGRMPGAGGTGPSILQAIPKIAGISFSSTTSYATVATLRAEPNSARARSIFARPSSALPAGLHRPI
ncbi:MAG: hypothetical protein VX741_07205 [Pseudomonadota bacterium]|nr:hypothetical protein [Pseudomonadota bacterium]